MKCINARTTLKLVFSFSWFIALAVARDGDAGDYYVYQEPNGKLVISNSAPPAGSKIIKKETLSEPTDHQIAESFFREHKVGLDNRLASLEKIVGELSDDLRAPSKAVDNLQQGHGDTNVAVGVTQGAAIVVKPPRNQFNRPTNFRHDLPNGQPRGAVPVPPQQRPGGRAR